MVRSLDGRLPRDSVVRAVVSERLRVLIIGDFSASKVGNASVAEQLARKLTAAGDIVLTTSDRTNRLARVAGMVFDAARFRRTVDVAIVDVYAQAGFRWAEWTTYLLSAAGTPVVLVLRGGDLPTFAETRGGRVTRLFAASSSIVALSGFLRDEMAPYGTISEIIPNPIEVSAYPFRRRSMVQPKLIWLRTFNRIYNPSMAPRVLAELLASIGSAPDSALPHLTMIGADQNDGSWEATVATAREVGVSERLTMTGPVPKGQVPARLAEGDIFLNTTDIDNTPISVIEAMACGLCVVSTDVGGMKYVIEDGVDGLLVPKGDPKAMASAIQRLLDNPDLADRLSSNARLRAEAVDWDKVLPRWRGHLAQVVRERVQR